MSDRHWLTAAIESSRLSPPAPDHYAVGAVIVGADGRVLATGYTGETDPHYHAEEAALAKLTGADLSGATLYTSLEPCTTRKSRPQSCAGLIIEAGIRRVVFALREPPVFVDGRGVETLLAAGVEVREMAELAPQVREVNNHILGDPVLDDPVLDGPALTDTISDGAGRHRLGLHDGSLSVTGRKTAKRRCPDPVAAKPAAPK